MTAKTTRLAFVVMLMTIGGLPLRDAAASPASFAPQSTRASLLVPAAATVDVSKSPHVGLRFGVHDGFDRLVLDWHQPVHARIHVDHGTASIKFDPPGRIDVNRLSDLVPAEMRPVKIRPDGSQLSFQVPAGRTIRDHSDGKLVVIDFVGESDAPAADQASAPEPAPPPAGSSKQPASPTGSTQSEPSPLQGFGEVEVADTADRQLQISGTPIDQGFSFRFRWDSHVKAAVFKLRTSLWIVFGQPEHVSFNPEAAGKEHIPALQQVDNKTATVLRLTVPQNTRVLTSRIDTTWIVDMRQPTATTMASDTPGPDRVLTNSGGFYRTKEPGQPVTVVDPDSNEILIAIPIFTAGKHFEVSTDNKTYIALPTSQGMLFRPEGDLARFGIEDTGVRVSTILPTLEKSDQ